MSAESQALRNGIRAGLYVCRCLWPTAYMETLDWHLPTCEWNNAVNRIYEIEREEDNGK